jgi:5-amino-6-(5-phosphoribosylamino)uracil reductase
VEERPYTLLSCSVSLDGYLDSPTMPRLPLSNAADFERIDAVRASCDAILVGANTIRRDNPRLLIRSEDRRRQREEHGLPASPVKVTVTETGDLDPGGQFFTAGTTDKIVYCPTATRRTLDSAVGCSATVVSLGAQVTVRAIAEDLAARGVRRLMIEGGATVHTQFLTDDLADELQLVIAPMFVGDSRARRFVTDGSFPWTHDQRAELADVQRIGDVVMLRYALSDRFRAEYVS